MTFYGTNTPKARLMREQMRKHEQKTGESAAMTEVTDLQVEIALSAGGWTEHGPWLTPEIAKDLRADMRRALEAALGGERRQSERRNLVGLNHRDKPSPTVETCGAAVEPKREMICRLCGSTYWEMLGHPCPVRRDEPDHPASGRQVDETKTQPVQPTKCPPEVSEAMKAAGAKLLWDWHGVGYTFGPSSAAAIYTAMELKRREEQTPTKTGNHRD